MLNYSNLFKISWISFVNFFFNNSRLLKSTLKYISIDSFTRLLSLPWLILDLRYVLINLSLDKLLSQLAVETVIVLKNRIVTSTLWHTEMT